MLGNIIFISCVEQDISLVRFAYSWDILFNTRNKFHISAQPCNILYLLYIFRIVQYDVKSESKSESKKNKADEKVEDDVSRMVTNRINNQLKMITNVRFVNSLALCTHLYKT